MSRTRVPETVSDIVARAQAAGKNGSKEKSSVGYHVGIPAYDMPNEIHFAKVAENFANCAIKNKLYFSSGTKITYELPFRELITKLEEFGEVYYTGGSWVFSLSPNVIVHSGVTSKSLTTRRVKFRVYTKQNIDEHEYWVKEVQEAFAPWAVSTKKFASVDWAIRKKDSIEYNNCEAMMTETIYPEAYPFVDNLHQHITDYFGDSSTVLILMGPPGTGKTRFIKYICQRIIEINDSCDILYSMDDHIFGEDGFFMRFLTGSYHALILEDIDYNLRSRKDGNVFMAKLLSGSDGFIHNANKKIILSTNLPSIKDTDDALLRPGRCFSVIQTRKLTSDEAQALLKKMGHEDIKLDGSDISLADIYKIAKGQ